MPNRRSEQSLVRRRNRDFKRYRDRELAETVWLDEDKAVKNFFGVVINNVDLTNYSFLENGEVLNDTRKRGSETKRDLIVAYLKNQEERFKR